MLPSRSISRAGSSRNSGFPPIGITMGCPAGIGPEIILRFYTACSSIAGTRPVVLGDRGVLERCGGEFDLPLRTCTWQPGEPVPRDPGRVPVLEISRLDPGSCRWGRPSVDSDRAMGRCIEEAVRLTLAGALAGMVTCPISKSGLRTAGYPYPGHTEMLAALSDTGDYAMMLTGSTLRVSLVTIHIPLAEVPRRLSRAEIFRIIRLTHTSLRQDFGVAAPRLAVAGLNPHSGEGGLFGDEEERIITPALLEAAERGWSVDGPLPPDTVFHRAAAGEFDAVVCMYHDQGLIPFKLLHFSDGVNVTLGLPLVRTSVDHGTAYDIAGRGLADPASLTAAVATAGLMISNRRAGGGESGEPAMHRRGRNCEA